MTLKSNKKFNQMEVLDFTVIGDTFKGHYVAISIIDETQFIFLSSSE